MMIMKEVKASKIDMDAIAECTSNKILWSHDTSKTTENRFQNFPVSKAAGKIIYAHFDK